MKPFTQHHGRIVTMDRSNVDTDQIIPKQFLKRIERTGFGQFLFYNWRFDQEGNPDPTFELNQPGAQGATILVARKNFGNGSSREHAVWALDDYGFRAILAESFADIFYNNCSKNGVLPVTLTEEEIETLHQKAAADPTYAVTVDLVSNTVSSEDGFHATFAIDPFRRRCFLEGLDLISLTLEHLDKINAYEKEHVSPWKKQLAP